MARVLITDGEQRSALAIVRSLDRAGHHCFVCSQVGRSLAGQSRHARREFRVPDPGSCPGDFGARVRDLTEDLEIDIVIPVSEQAILAVLTVRDTMHAAVPFPDLETFKAICNKKRVLAAARDVGIRVPRQWEISSPSQSAAAEIPPAVVLKPTRSVYTAADGTRGKVGVRWVRSRSELTSAQSAYPADAYPLLAQEQIIGPGTGVFVLVQDGRCLASFSHLRIREKPPSGGVSVVCRAEPMDERVLTRSLKLLAHFEWCGLAMVEYKRDATTGEPVLMEINGRFWGSLQLAIASGVDFPRLLVDATLGAEAPTVRPYRLARSRWFWGDVDNMIARLREPDTSMRSRTAAVLGWLRAFGPGYREEVFRWDDPRPFLHETGAWLRDITRSAGGRPGA